MNKRAVKRWAGGLALVAGAIGTTLLLRRRRKTMSGEIAVGQQYQRDRRADRWARPGMSVTFRAELMPGRSRAERTFKVAALLPSNRVTLQGFTGEHTDSEFEPLR